ncbi:flagellar biosynthesis protein FlhA [Treponema peruense]|uniref:FHIPEP family type III secretion protein n=1 Tax=Treponema peruense TaxID=2787628 RepID=A0A7T3V3X5_9SPIR|nr:flagellar biosynthesis protein FlhA [Treponema peruense]QPZ99981.1 FHIPEP family type III secretion protein [Treponema peruense]
MPEKQTLGKTIFSFITSNILPVAALVVVMFMFIPLGKTVIDIMMVLNLAVSFVILLTVVYMKRAADFSSFPRVVLLVTLFGLAINVASTRNILMNPVSPSGIMTGQSEMVQAFANIVAGDNVIIGFIIFIILIVVQVLVVTKGADRVSEVSARFTLDSMNSKMFVIQNQMQSGSITEDEANLKIAQLRQEIDFYSAMDGSSKFVSGNVKAGIFITVVNLVGGMITGIMAGLSPMVALNSYAKLTIGDGLMSQLPALLLSFSTGLLVTGSSSEEFLSDQLKKQFSLDGTIYCIVGAALAVLGFAFHNGSTFYLVGIGAVLVIFGARIKKSQETQAVAKKAAEAESRFKKQTGGGPEDLSPVVKLDELSLEIGYALFPLVDKEKGAEILERITKIRREEAHDLGLVVPPIHIIDQMELEPEEYSFKIRGIEVGRSRLKIGYYMCLNTGNVPKDKIIVGEQTRDPAFGMEAIWLPESRKLEAEKAGYAVIDLPTILATHLTELIKRHAANILTRQEVKNIVEKIRESNPVVVDEVMSGEHKFTYGEIEAVLKNLLAEQVSIRNMVTILETLGDYGKITRDIWQLSEKVREALGAQICSQYVDENKVLHVMNLSQELSQKILEHRAEVPGKKPFVAFDPVDARRFISAMGKYISAVRDRNFLPIVLCPDEVRLLVKSATEREIPGLVVLSIGEVMAAGPDIKVEALGEINEQ